MTSRLPTVFVPHGAGPCFFMAWDPPDTWAAMGAWLRALPRLAGSRPRALLVVSAHWEAPQVTLTAAAAPALVYDYHGFPAHTYALEWPAPGDPALARRTAGLLAGAGIAAGLDSSRGLDHGVFIPMKLAFPEADVPVVQLSLRADLDPAHHDAVGRALAPLRDDGVLLVGSGMSYHNMAHFRRGDGVLDPASRTFDDWLADTVTLPEEERRARLLAWGDAPGARAAHPREEHLLPLHVVAGAAGADKGERVFSDEVLGSVQAGYRFG